MRLPTEEKDAIITAIANYDKNASVFLFGSRTDESKKGGDINPVPLFLLARPG